MNPYNRAPMYAGGMNVPGAPGNLGSYASLPLDEAVQQIERQEEDYQRKKFEYDMNPNNQPQPYHPETNPVFPDYPSGRPTGTNRFAQQPYFGNVQEVAEMPRFIRGNYAPGGAIIKAPHLDSPYIDEQIRRGWTPMTPPPGRSPGPQLFPLVQAPANFDMKYVS
jgi:hypothetical protein